MAEPKLGYSGLPFRIIQFKVDQEPGCSLVSLLVLIQVENQLSLDGEGERLVGGVRHGLLQDHHAGGEFDLDTGFGVCKKSIK